MLGGLLSGGAQIFRGRAKYLITESNDIHQIHQKFAYISVKLYNIFNENMENMESMESMLAGGIVEDRFHCQPVNHPKLGPFVMCLYQNIFNFKLDNIF